MNGWIDRYGWIHCPTCGNKTRTKVNPDTVLKRFPLFCPKCGKEHIVDVQGDNKIFQLLKSQTPRRRADDLQDKSCGLSAFTFGQRLGFANLKEGIICSDKKIL